MSSFVHLIDQRRLIGPGGSTVSGTIYFYYTGTSVLAPIYQDASMLVPSPNPVTVGAGEIVPEIFLNEDISYRRVILYSDGTFDEQDPLGSLFSEGEIGLPVGAVIDYSGPTAPEGFLFCFGQAINRTEYADLFAAIGTTYGSGNGTTTFNVPDYRGRVGAGKDNMGGVAANRLVTNVTGTTLGANGGEEGHTLTTPEIPSHTHGVTDPGHNHDYYGATGGSNILGYTAAATGALQTTQNRVTNITINAAGGGGAHNNVQPTIVVNKIIKATPVTFLSLLGITPDFTNKANATALGIASTANDMGEFTGSILPDNEDARQVFQVLADNVETREVAAFSQVGSYTANTVRKKLQEIVSIKDAPYNAVGDGLTNDAPAFQAALDALPVTGGRIYIPGGTYLLNTEPTWGTKSVYLDISPAATFTGAGTGEGKFPYMDTNAAQLAVGPYIYSQSYQKSTNPNGGTAAFNVEMKQPDDYGAGQQCAMFLGARSNAANVAANTWGLNIVSGILSAATGIHQGIEVDIDTNSSAATTKGIAITGGGSADADFALQIDRAANKWGIGVDIGKCQNGIVMTGISGGTGITAHAPGASVAGSANTFLQARQFANSADTIFLQRFTDTAPAGYFLRAVNAANSTNLAIIDYAGNMTLAGTSFAASVTGSFSSSSGVTAFVGKNTSSASVTSKFVEASFSGRDTTNDEKVVGGLKYEPKDVNWVDSKVTISTRKSDAVVPALILMGTGSPEGVVTAPVGTLYTRSDGGAGTTLYVKESGSGNTGWVSK